MERLKSWRWSRLLDEDGIKRADCKEVKFSLIIFVIVFCAVVFVFNWYKVAFILTIAYALYVLGKICTSDAFYEIKDKKTKNYVKIYVYKSYNYKFPYNVYIKENNDLSVIAIDDYEWIICSDKSGWFTFVTNDIWYYLEGIETIMLGKRIGNIMFLDLHSSKMPMLKTLNSKGILNIIPIDEIFYDDDIDLPELEFFASDNTDYALIKIDNEYKLISTSYIPYGDKGMMFFSYERFKSVIFKEKGQTAIAVWDEKIKKYKILYRLINMIDDLKTFVEVKNNQLPGIGCIYKFGRKRKDLSEVYKGVIRGIDKEKRIIICEEGSTGYSY